MARKGWRGLREWGPNAEWVACNGVHRLPGVIILSRMTCSKCGPKCARATQLGR